MIKKKLTKTIACTMFAGAMLFSSAVFAQVKIGTAPTAIDPANNLEVQGSTAGRKVAIDKVTGKVTIADGSEGAAKVLTSDAAGIATWQLPVQTSPVQVKVSGTNQSCAINGVATSAVFGTTYFDLGSNKSGNTVVITEAGLYDVSANVMFQASFTGTSSNGVYLSLNGASVEQLAGVGQVSGATTLMYGKTVARFVPGDVVSFTVLTTQNNGTFNLVSASRFAVTKLSN